jgi:hypothetical protein
VRAFDGTEQFAEGLCCVPWQESSDHICALQESLKALRATNRASSACTGLTLVQLLEKALDEVYDDLMEYEGNDESTVAEMRGRAQGLAAALAILRRPHYPNMDEVRREASERYTDRQV